MRGIEDAFSKAIQRKKTTLKMNTFCAKSRKLNEIFKANLVLRLSEIFALWVRQRVLFFADSWVYCSILIITLYKFLSNKSNKVCGYVNTLIFYFTVSS